jgi:hypothetical protein
MADSNGARCLCGQAFRGVYKKAPIAVILLSNETSLRQKGRL